MLQISSTVIVGTPWNNTIFRYIRILFYFKEISRYYNSMNAKLSLFHLLLFRNTVNWTCLSLWLSQVWHMIDRKQIIGTLRSFSGGLAKVCPLRKNLYVVPVNPPNSYFQIDLSSYLPWSRKPNNHWVDAFKIWPFRWFIKYYFGQIAIQNLPKTVA